MGAGSEHTGGKTKGEREAEMGSNGGFSTEWMFLPNLLADTVTENNDDNHLYFIIVKILCNIGIM